MTEHLPVADSARVDMAERIFSEYRTMTPEEWAARFAHTVGASSFDQYRYLNPALHNWIHRLHQIFGTPGMIDRCRETYLTPEEFAQIKNDSLEF